MFTYLLRSQLKFSQCCLTSLVLMVSVDVKQHVYLLTSLPAQVQSMLLDVFGPYGFCGRQATLTELELGAK